MAQTFDISARPRDNARRAHRVRRLRSALDTFFAGLGQGFNAYLTARARTDELERLNAMSDKQLTALGLRREDIPRHVFRDFLNF